MSISPDWLAAASQCQEAILITVAASKGSVPRAAGAKMVVTRDQQFDTIGGGHLEHQALALARDAAGLDGQRSTGELGLEDLWHWL